MANVPLPESELERLLQALLRLVGPALAGGSTGSPGAAVVPPLSASEARALIELGAAHGIAQGELAGLLGLEKSTVSRLAAGLEHKGWIRRGRDQEDQRYVRLHLTDEGGAVARQVWQAWRTRQARILAGLSIEERLGLAAGLRGLVRGLAAEGLATEGLATEGLAAGDLAAGDLAGGRAVRI